MKRFVYLLILFALIATACGGEKATSTPFPTKPPPTPEEEAEAMSISPEQVVNILWQWSDLVETAPAAQSVVPDPENYTIVFNPDGTVNIKADCNMVKGGYTLDGGALSIQLGPSTMAFCGEQSLDQQYLGLLSQVGSASLENGRLMLHLRDDAGRLGFNNGGAAAAAPAGGGLSPEALRNGTYFIENLGEIQLTDGTYENKYGEGATMVDTVELESLALGDLNGDGVDDGAVVLWWSGGGSGVFGYLAAVVDEGGMPRQAAIQAIGDRTQIESLAIDNGQIVIQAITHGPEDPMCCPTQQVVDIYELQGDQLVQTSSEVVGTVGSIDGGDGGSG